MHRDLHTAGEHRVYWPDSTAALVHQETQAHASWWLVTICTAGVTSMSLVLQFFALQVGLSLQLVEDDVVSGRV